MTLLHMDGFDLGDFALRDYAYSGATAAASATAFSSGRCIATGADNSYWAKNVTASTHIYTGCRIYIPGTYTTTLTLRGDSGATTHISLAINGTGSATLTCGGTQRATAGAGTFGTGGVWFYVEVDATISDTVGVCNVRLNGDTTPVMTYTGDTKNGGTNTTIDQIRWTQSGNNNSVLYDDLYICDSNGSANNGFLGDVRVITLMPTGAGNSTGMTPSTGSNWAAVDEQPYSTTDYVSSSVTNTKDTYTLADLPGTISTVLAVQEMLVAQKNDAGPASVKTVLRTGGTDYASSAVALGTAPQTVMNSIRETNPNTSTAWTVANVNAAEFGAQVG